MLNTTDARYDVNTIVDNHTPKAYFTSTLANGGIA
jgi:hypothetical protein